MQWLTRSGANDRGSTFLPHKENVYSDCLGFSAEELPVISLMLTKKKKKTYFRRQTRGLLIIGLSIHFSLSPSLGDIQRSYSIIKW